jgi:hypothetical protein
VYGRNWMSAGGRCFGALCSERQLALTVYAIARLAEAMQSRDEVLVRLSSVIFIKTGGCVFASVLTEAQIRLINDNPHLMRAPAAMMDALARLQTGSSATNAIESRPE